MKTTLEWFRTLPEPICSQAINNTEKGKLLYTCTKASTAIMISFNWDVTPEGGNYWGSIYVELRSQKSYTKYLKQKV